MFLGSSRMSFAVAELSQIDSSIRFTQKELQAEYDGLIYRNSLTGLGKPPVILASLISQEQEARKFLLANGFELVGEEKTNPNTANKIQTYMKKQTSELAPDTQKHYQNWLVSFKPNGSTYTLNTYIGGSAISCGVLCLNNPELLSAEKTIERALTFSARPQCAILTAVINQDKLEQIKTLTDNGFFKICDSVHYITNEPFSVFMRYVSKLDRGKYGCQTRFDVENKTE